MQKATSLRNNEKLLCSITACLIHAAKASCLCRIIFYHRLVMAHRHFSIKRLSIIIVIVVVADAVAVAFVIVVVVFVFIGISQTGAVSTMPRSGLWSCLVDYLVHLFISTLWFALFSWLVFFALLFAVCCLSFVVLLFALLFGLSLFGSLFGLFFCGFWWLVVLLCGLSWSVLLCQLLWSVLLCRLLWCVLLSGLLWLVLLRVFGDGVLFTASLLWHSSAVRWLNCGFPMLLVAADAFKTATPLKLALEHNTQQQQRTPEQQQQ